MQLQDMPVLAAGGASGLGEATAHRAKRVRLHGGTGGCRAGATAPIGDRRAGDPRDFCATCADPHRHCATNLEAGRRVQTED
jgi:hypothetical protein